MRVLRSLGNVLMNPFWGEGERRFNSLGSKSVVKIMSLAIEEEKQSSLSKFCQLMEVFPEMKKSIGLFSVSTGASIVSISPLPPY